MFCCLLKWRQVNLLNLCLKYKRAETNFLYCCHNGKDKRNFFCSFLSIYRKKVKFFVLHTFAAKIIKISCIKGEIWVAKILFVMFPRCEFIALTKHKSLEKIWQMIFKNFLQFNSLFASLDVSICFRSVDWKRIVKESADVFKNQYEPMFC